MANHRSYLRIGGLVIAAMIAAPCAADGPVIVKPLLKTDMTVLGQKLGYRTDGPLEITASLVEVAPGASLVEHLHPVPTFGFVLEGELTVHYEDHGSRTYKSGEALMEAVNLWHRGENKGDVPVRILVVYMGIAGVSNSIPR
jgi:quercetin dioxygenase-like cupin family protein